jgi:SRSO17 transposase
MSFVSHCVLHIEGEKLFISSSRVERRRMKALEYAMDEGAAARVAGYFERIGKHMPLPQHRASFATFAFGILADGDRKSVEPIAARASGGDKLVAERTQDRLLHFLREAPWSDREVRREAARYAIEAMSAREPITALIIDDTGFLKQGTQSPGVQRQYTGSAGKIANCQIGVSLCIATATEQVPIDFELYLPKAWTDDVARRERARIPESVVFKTKIELAMDLIARAVEDGIPGEVVLADAAYGRARAFRDFVRNQQLDYAVAVDADGRVWLLDESGRDPDAVTVSHLGVELGQRAFRKITWRDGTRPHKKLSSRFAFRRVKPAFDGGTEPMLREPAWLVIEWPEGESRPTKFFLTSLRRRMSKKEIVRTIKERWKTERAYEELKGELGLDHFEGRSYTGWHHHISVVLCCYAFVVAERVRAFSPQSRRPGQADTVSLAA